ncbi:uncharacterized [Tachysurus ichikawai]
MAVDTVDDITINLPKAEASFKNEAELEIIYPAEIKTSKEKKKFKEMPLRNLKDSFTELEHDYYLFKEETTNHLGRLQFLTNDMITDQLQQLFSAIKCLEETIQELSKELWSVKEELFRRDQYSTELQQELRSVRQDVLKKEQHS